MMDEARADGLDLTRPQPFLRPFPDPAAVFAGDAERAGKLMHPLVSIDLAAVDEEWQGWIHLVSPIEPEQPFEEETGEFPDSLSSRNWLAFRLTDDSRYELIGDWRMFRAERDDPAVRNDPELVEHYERQHRSFAGVEAAWREHGLLLNADRAALAGWDAVLEHPLAFVELWNEPQGDGNWAENEALPVVRVERDDCDDVYPLTEDGRPFRFIAAVPGWNYRDAGADLILLFFDPETRTALLTFDWT